METRNEITSQTSPSNQGHCWSNSEKAELVKALTVIVQGQNAYGKKHDLAHLLAYYEFKLQRRYSVAQVLHALDIYTDRHDDIPTPAGIIAILSPEPPKITEAQYVNACKWQERNGYPIFSDARDLIEEYHRQNNPDNTVPKISDQRIAGIISASVNKVGG